MNSLSLEILSPSTPLKFSKASLILLSSMLWMTIHPCLFGTVPVYNCHFISIINRNLFSLKSFLVWMLNYMIILIILGIHSTLQSSSELIILSILCSVGFHCSFFWMLSRVSLKIIVTIYFWLFSIWLPQ